MIASTLVVIGASAGGVEALTRLLDRLPADFAAAVRVGLHRGPQSPNVLGRIIARNTALEVRTAQDDGEVTKGCIYVAPADCHLMVSDGRTQVVRGPKENCHRPAINPLFRSAAYEYGHRAIGVILTGNLDDGVDGLATIKARGGTALVQSPRDALFPGMPTVAIERVEVDHVLALKDLGPMLVRLVSDMEMTNGDHNGASPNREKAHAVDPILLDSTLFPDAGEKQNEAIGGKPSGYSCPDCSGVLWEFKQGPLTRFRCRVGHAFSEASVVHAQSTVLERAMWSALVALQENASMATAIASRASANGRPRTASFFLHRSEELLDSARTIRQVMLTLPVLHEDHVGLDAADESSVNSPL